MNKIVLTMAAGAAGVLAIGGAGLYAGALATTTPGGVGSGAVALQASCASAATITPDAAVWVAGEQKWKYPTATVTYTANSTCVDQEATVNVYAADDGVALNTAAVHAITPDENTAGSFQVTFDGTGVDAAIVAADYKYGLVIQSA